MAGHSKWANIKHKKARQDQKRGKAWSKCSKAIMVAAKAGGGDPVTNLGLRYAIDEAKAANMPKDTIENAIKKGCGDLEGVNYESIIYEGYGPNGVAVMLDILTDKRTRTAPEVKKIFEKYGGNLGTTGSVSYIFDAKGQVAIPKAKEDGSEIDEDMVMTAVLDAGAEDVMDEDEIWLIQCDKNDFIAVREAAETAGLPIASAEITMVPNNTVTCTGKDARKVYHLVEALEDHDDIQKVHANFDIPDEEMAALGEE